MDYSSNKMTKHLSDRELLEGIHKEISNVSTRLDTVEHSVYEWKKEITGSLQELERGVSFIEYEFEEMKGSLLTFEQRIAEIENHFEDRLTDLGNRSRRNNMILHNVQEKAEGEDCIKFVQDFIKNTMNVEVEIEAAHRTPAVRHDPSKARIIHARCLRRKDRDLLLTEGRKLLKSYTQPNGRKVFITDDLEPRTREEDKKLREKARALREEGYIAVIPLKIPRVLLYKKKDLPSSPWKTIHPKQYNVRDQEMSHAVRPGASAVNQAQIRQTVSHEKATQPIVTADETGDTAAEHGGRCGTPHLGVPRATDAADDQQDASPNSSMPQTGGATVKQNRRGPSPSSTTHGAGASADEQKRREASPSPAPTRVSDAATPRRTRWKSPKRRGRRTQMT